MVTGIDVIRATCKYSRHLTIVTITKHESATLTRANSWLLNVNSWLMEEFDQSKVFDDLTL